MSKLKGEIYKDKKGEWRGRAKSKGNGKNIAGTEGYKNKSAAQNALELLGINKKDITEL